MENETLPPALVVRALAGMFFLSGGGALVGFWTVTYGLALGPEFGVWGVLYVGIFCYFHFLCRAFAGRLVFGTSLLAGLWNGLIQSFRVEDYLARNPSYGELFASVPTDYVASRLLVQSVLIGAIFGFALTLLTVLLRTHQARVQTRVFEARKQDK